MTVGIGLDVIVAGDVEVIISVEGNALVGIDGAVLDAGIAAAAVDICVAPVLGEQPQTTHKTAITVKMPVAYVFMNRNISVKFVCDQSTAVLSRRTYGIPRRIWRRDTVLLAL